MGLWVQSWPGTDFVKTALGVLSILRVDPQTGTLDTRKAAGSVAPSQGVNTLALHQALFSLSMQQDPGPALMELAAWVCVI